MSYLDTRITELMSETDAHLLRSSQPLGWLGLTRNLLRGRLGWTVWVNILTQVVFLGSAIWMALEFFAATEVLAALKYGLTAAVLAIVAVQFKMSLMPHVQTERVLRALKRVEILILSHGNKD